MHVTMANTQIHLHWCAFHVLLSAQLVLCPHLKYFHVKLVKLLSFCKADLASKRVRHLNIQIRQIINALIVIQLARLVVEEIRQIVWLALETSSIWINVWTYVPITFLPMWILGLVQLVLIIVRNAPLWYLDHVRNVNHCCICKMDFAK
jgi:hypothetical protein